MGAGRRTETVNFNSHSNGAGSGGAKVAPQRKLAERGRLGSVIFGCTSATYQECVTNKIFGLPYSHFAYVAHIEPGMPLFLFNYHDRHMHGIFEAVTEGALSISPSAWTSGDPGARTQFPAQVRVQLRSDTTRMASLPESVFKETIIDNYFSPSHFFFELDSEQTERLIKLFQKSLGNSFRQPPVVSKAPVSLAPPSNNPWQTVGSTSKVWKKTSGSAETDDKLKMKKPAVVVMSEWEKGAQYISSSREATSTEPRDEESVWANLNNEENSESETSEEFAVSHRVAESSAEENGKRLAYSNLNCDVKQDVHAKSVNSVAPKTVIISDPYNCTAEKANRAFGSEGVEWTEAKRTEMQRILGRLQQLTTDQVESASSQSEVASDPSPVSGLSEWERLARERATQEQAVLKEERENIGDILGKLDLSVAVTVKKNLELYSSALAQVVKGALAGKNFDGPLKDMRQDGIELRRLIEDARLRAEEARLRAEAEARTQTVLASQEATILSMSSRICALEHIVSELSKPIGRSLTERVGDAFLKDAEVPCKIQTSEEVYLIGGLGDQLSRLESVMVWSPVKDHFRTAASMLTPRCCAGASVLNEEIYVFGGGDGTSWYDTVERYDRNLDEWKSCAPMRTQRGSLGGVTVGDRIYALGGGNGLASFSEVECFDPHLAAWLPCTSMLEKRFCVAATELGGVLYAFGGFDGEQYLMSVERFDPREALWSRLPSMSVKRGSLSAAVLNGRIYTLGGYDGEAILDVVETFDPRAGRWDMGPSMCGRRAYGAVAAVGEALYYLGGLSEDEAADPEERSTYSRNELEEDEGGKVGQDDFFNAWNSTTVLCICYRYNDLPNEMGGSLCNLVSWGREVAWWRLFSERQMGTVIEDIQVFKVS